MFIITRLYDDKYVYSEYYAEGTLHSDGTITKTFGFNGAREMKCSKFMRLCVSILDTTDNSVESYSFPNFLDILIRNQSLGSHIWGFANLTSYLNDKTYILEPAALSYKDFHVGLRVMTLSDVNSIVKYTMLGYKFDSFGTLFEMPVDKNANVCVIPNGTTDINLSSKYRSYLGDCRFTKLVFPASVISLDTRLLESIHYYRRKKTRGYFIELTEIEFESVKQLYKCSSAIVPTLTRVLHTYTCRTACPQTDTYYNSLMNVLSMFEHYNAYAMFVFPDITYVIKDGRCTTR